MRGTYAILARRMELFRGIGPEHVARIFAQGHTLEFTPGQIIFEKGAPGDKMFAILIGEVAIFDEERQLAVLGRGDMFGEMALLSQEPRSASAQALVNTSLLSLDRDSIQRSLPAEVSIALLTNVIVTLGERIRLANQLIHELRRG
jgi:CRP-like cAMP-binding protein